MPKTATIEQLTPKHDRQIFALCKDLVLHSFIFNNFVIEGGQINNPVIRGHVETHLEKIGESIGDIQHIFALPKRPPTPAYGAHNQGDRMTQVQSLKLLQRNIQKFVLIVTGLLDEISGQIGADARRPLNELSRNLNNDLCRTSYMLR